MPSLPVVANDSQTSRASDYRPPAWLASLSRLHEKQGLDVPVRRAPPKPSAIAVDPARSQAVAPAAGKSSVALSKRNLWPMKIFFLLVSVSLMLSTLTGMHIGWRHARHRSRYGATLVAGIAVPALLLLF